MLLAVMNMENVLKLIVSDQKGEVVLESQPGTKPFLVLENEYRAGDRITIESSKSGCYLIIQLEDSLPATFVYVPGNVINFTIPFGEKRNRYSPKSFSGPIHLITARLATPDEIAGRRDLALNPYDQHGENGFFPHVIANAETRGEAVFAAQNAINGIFANDSHGTYPYLSWGIDCRPDAELKIDFGRPVMVDEAVLTIRADFPHDNYWTQITLVFSDLSELKVHLNKTAESQRFKFDAKTVDWIIFKDLLASSETSTFPALTEIEFWGTELPNRA